LASLGTIRVQIRTMLEKCSSHFNHNYIFFSFTIQRILHPQPSHISISMLRLFLKRRVHITRPQNTSPPLGRAYLTGVSGSPSQPEEDARAECLAPPELEVDARAESPAPPKHKVDARAVSPTVHKPKEQMSNRHEDYLVCSSIHDD